jgi:FMN-dependent NADH-azoreductase
MHGRDSAPEASLQSGLSEVRRLMGESPGRCRFFAIPSALKAWIDHIVRAGRTFGFGPSGPVGLVSSGKKVIVVSARGGLYSAGPMKALDYQETYLQTVLEFIGLKDIAFVRAEGVAMGPDGASEAMKVAEAQLTAVMRNAA